MQVRVYLTGRMAVETSAGIADEAQFPGRQGRLAFVFLGLSAQRPVARDVLADAIWGLEQPAAWESAVEVNHEQAALVVEDSWTVRRRCVGVGLLPAALAGRVVD